MDIKLKADTFGNMDLEFSSNDLVKDEGLETAVLISLFTDRQIESDEIPLGESSRRGFWADTVSETQGDKIGSRLWLLAREKKTEETRLKAEEYAYEALQWLIEDGVAQSVKVSSEFQEQGTLALAVDIEKPTGEQMSLKFKTVWDKQYGV